MLKKLMVRLLVTPRGSRPLLFSPKCHQQPHPSANITTLRCLTAGSKPYSDQASDNTYNMAPRAPTAGPDAPEPPYPVTCDTLVIPGFGRGSADLGIPTANIPQQAFDSLETIGSETGVYFGWAAVYSASTASDQSEVEIPRLGKSDKTVLQSFGKRLSPNDEAGKVFPMVMSVGWNPFYGNKKKSAEIHIIHKFAHSFYGARIKFMVLGYVRPELNYTTKEALIEDINTDIRVAEKSLEREEYAKYKQDAFFKCD